MAWATLAFMALSGAASIPGQWAQLEQAYEQAAALCRQTGWCLHRTEQLVRLNKELQDDISKYLEPALTIAQTSKYNWQYAKVALAADRVIMYVNAGVLAVIMIVYVAMAWLMLSRKSSTLKEAFEAVRRA